MKKILVGVLILVAGLFLLSTPCVLAQDICEGDFDCDKDVDGADAAVFKKDFGRSGYKNPCPDCISTCDPPAPVPKTWQWISYATGDDGDYEHGAMWPDPRFTDNGDGTITDNLTGLMWLKNANCFGMQRWADALSSCNGLAAGYCGLTDGSTAGDWRLPNIKELISLIHYGFVDPALPCTAGPCQWEEGDPFSNVQLDAPYWSSTTLPDGTDYVWRVEMYNGHMAENGKTGFNYIWPVRGGQ